ncbi:MAG TPA: hypothetical protein VE058_04430, partial [Steroidobacteraceae bacterium]|nr:hypothetical protein [Steroidobacteraceae bacterium]
QTQVQMPVQVQVPVPVWLWVRVPVWLWVRVRVPVWVRVPVLVRKRAVAETAAAGAMGLSPVASSTHSRPRAEPRLTRQPKNAAGFVCP